jgi:DNA-binding NarL/FixJ family response regulator
VAEPARLSPLSLPSRAVGFAQFDGWRANIHCVIEPQTRVLVADGHPSVRENLRYLVNAEADLACVGVAKDPIQVLERCRALTPNVLVLGDGLAGISTLGVAEQVRLAAPQIRVVGYTQDDAVCQQAPGFGLVACVSKAAGYKLLLSAVRDAAALRSSGLPTEVFADAERHHEPPMPAVANDLWARVRGPRGEMAGRVRRI